MHISDVKIEELQRLYQDIFHFDISTEDARELGSHLVQIIELICFTQDDISEN
jgi:hypothetical protein